MSASRGEECTESRVSLSFLFVGADTHSPKSHFLFAKGLFCTRGFFMTHRPGVAARICQNSRGMTSGHTSGALAGGDRPNPF